jgi:hypothetical protein
VIPDAARELARGLAAAAAAFEEADAIAASAELDRVVAACAALDATGARLDPAALEDARLLWSACAASAERAGRVLAERMQSAGGARRAAAAYR